jgi:hypothetical protein
MQNSQTTQNYGLQALTPIYGQVIQAAPTWSGPYVPTPIPPPVQQPKQPSELGKWIGLFGNIGVTAACSVAVPEFMLACPLAGQAADIGINELFN